MEKTEIKFQMPEEKLVHYKEKMFKMRPFLQMAEMVYLINEYIEDYFNISENPLVKLNEYNYIQAEFKLLHYICQLLTNIDMEYILDEKGEDGTPGNNIFVDPEFIDALTGNIKNYAFFRNNLETVISEMKEQLALKNSVGKVISDLIEKAYGVLDKFSEMSPEELEKIQKQGVELIERLEKSSVLGTPVKE